jgi:hypothetical protein
VAEGFTRTMPCSASTNNVSPERTQA